MSNSSNDCNSIWESSGCSLSVLAATIGMSVSSQYNASDLITIGSFLTALADIILLNAQQKSRLEEIIETTTPKTNRSCNY